MPWFKKGNPSSKRLESVNTSVRYSSGSTLQETVKRVEGVADNNSPHQSLTRHATHIMAGIDTGRISAAVSKILRSSSRGRVGDTSAMALGIVVK
jgi:hypothetical protein